MQSIILGTAQWGLAYGATNAVGRLSNDAIRGIIAAACEASVATLDTAPAYGDAESRVAELVPSSISVQTKISARGTGARGLRDALAAGSLAIGRRPIAVLVHDWAELDPRERTSASGLLEVARSEGVVAHVGVSGYTEADLATALDAFTLLDVAQMPVSVLDQRLEGSGAVAALRAAGGRLQARSIYLQGVAAGGPGGQFGDHEAVLRLKRTATEWGISAVDICAGYVRSRAWIDEVVVGVTSAEELWAFVASSAPDGVVWSELASDDVALLDPRRWPAAEQGG